MSDLPRDFLDLADRALAGPLSSADRDAFERHLLETPGAMAHYLRLAEVDALLPDALAQVAGRNRSEQNIIRPARSLWRRLALPAAVAASVALALTLARTREFTPAQARITRTVAARWTTPPTGAHLAAGELSGGFAELTLPSGVRLLVEGPAKFAITGDNAARFEHGKVFADVPPGAEGFTLDSPRERIIDHGTRFVADIAKDAVTSTVAVVSGEIEVRHADKQLLLFTDYALHRDGETLASVPFVKNRVATELPTREYAWDITGTRLGETQTLRFDVSKLVPGPGDFRAVAKWLSGRDAAIINRVSLLRDDTEVAAYTKPGTIGSIQNTENNAPALRLSSDQFRAGAKWTLVVKITTSNPQTKDPFSNSSGLLCFESDLSLHAAAKDFVGRWRYTHNGDSYVREFRADGTAHLEINGKPYAHLQQVRYTVKDGTLALTTPNEGLREQHMLRDDGTLVFLNQPYRNARRE